MLKFVRAYFAEVQINLLALRAIQIHEERPVCLHFQLPCRELSLVHGRNPANTPQLRTVGSSFTLVSEPQVADDEDPPLAVVALGVLHRVYRVNPECPSGERSRFRRLSLRFRTSKALELAFPQLEKLRHLVELDPWHHGLYAKAG